MLWNRVWRKIYLSSKKGKRDISFFCVAWAWACETWSGRIRMSIRSGCQRASLPLGPGERHLLVLADGVISSTLLLYSSSSRSGKTVLIFILVNFNAGKQLPDESPTLTRVFYYTRYVTSRHYYTIPTTTCIHTYMSIRARFKTLEHHYSSSSSSPSPLLLLPYN